VDGRACCGVLEGGGEGEVIGGVVTEGRGAGVLHGTGRRAPGLAAVLREPGRGPCAPIRPRYSAAGPRPVPPEWRPGIFRGLDWAQYPDASLVSWAADPAVGTGGCAPRGCGGWGSGGCAWGWIPCMWGTKQA
jgi:hypothetical protein